jgi:alpha-galactosidase/6-phospho-beta-glucosidase family protein
MPNRGQVGNLPGGVVVETWAEINGSGIFPLLSGDIPGNLTGFMQTVVDEQEAAVRAAVTGDRNMLVQAMAVSPELQNKDMAEELAEELLQANRDFLPQFFESSHQ